MRQKRSQKPTLVIVRGSQPRMNEINFYSHFSKFKITVIGDKTTGWVVDNKIPANVEFINSPLYPVWGFDPWTQILGKYHAHRSFQFVRDLDKYVSENDVINISDLFYFYCWQSALLAKKYRKKLVTIVWETIPKHITFYMPPYCFGVQKVLKQTDLFIARSKLAKDYLLSIGAPAVKIKVIYKGIDVVKFRPKIDIGKKNKTVILYVGQLVKSKGILELLEAFELLYQEFKNIELWLLGRSFGEPLEKKILEYAKSLPIKMWSQVPYDQLPEIYQEADIYCHLSQDWKYLGLIPGGNDWFPYTVIEAMASGLPVVATDVGGIPEQLGKIGNIYVKQKDVDLVYRGLKTYILNSKLRKQVSRKNRKRVEEMFDIKKQAKKTEEAILELFS